MDDVAFDGGDVRDRVVRPVPWRGPVARVRARLGPWLAWFGAGRLVGMIATAVVAVGVGWWLLRPAAPPTEAGLPYASASPSSTTLAGPTTSADTTTTAAASAVVVHVAGAVVAPGVYQLPPAARIVDALTAAGGARADAAVDALNLAAPVSDGTQVYVPVVGEPPRVEAAAAPTAAVPAAAGSATVTAAPAGPVDLNRASAADLDELPGIGPATAAAIVAHRQEQGPFASVEDLEAVRGIGPAKLDALRGLVTT